MSTRRRIRATRYQPARRSSARIRAALDDALVTLDSDEQWSDAKILSFGRLDDERNRAAKAPRAQRRPVDAEGSAEHEAVVAVLQPPAEPGEPKPARKTKRTSEKAKYIPLDDL